MCPLTRVVCAGSLSASQPRRASSSYSDSDPSPAVSPTRDMETGHQASTSPDGESRDESDKEDDDNDKGKSSSNNGSNAADIRVTRFECSDATADVAWSLSDPWVYATLSYDGAIVVHHVPSKEKYKILL